MKRLPPELAQHLQNHDLIVFDGECVLCSGFFRFMLRLDRNHRFRFALAQSDLGQQLYDALNLPLDDFETNLVIVNGRIFQRLDAFVAAMGAIGGVWRILTPLRFIPAPIKDFLYHRIARNRYAIFGRYDECLYPTPELRARFIEGGF